MTQGLVSLVVNGSVRYKIITGSDGYNAKSVAAKIRNHIIEVGEIPSISTLFNFVEECDFGGRERAIILDVDPSRMRKAIIHPGDSEFDDETRQRYLDTAYVAQFNPRWKYGTADYVEVVDVLVVKQ